LIRQVAVVGLSIVPFSISASAAYLAWAIFPSIEAWHMIVTVLVWIAAFAAGTELFWKVVGLLASKQ
jgi:hypothetical protein